MKSFTIVVLTIITNLSLLDIQTNFLVEQNRELPPIKLEKNFITPDNGLRFEEAKLIIHKKLKKQIEERKYKGELEIIEITTNELWSTSNYQLYRIVTSFFNGFAIIKENQITKILQANALLGIYLADLDNDKVYEVYMNNSVGSGIISEEIMGYNVIQNEIYNLSMRTQKDFKLFIKDGTLKVIIQEYLNLARKEIGILKIDRNYLPKLLIKIKNKN